MNYIYFRMFHNILGKTTEPKTGVYCFHVPQSGSDPVIVEIRLEENVVISSTQRIVSQDLWSLLHNDQEHSRDSTQELEKISLDITNAARQVLALVKYNLGWIDVNEMLLSHKNHEWSDDQETWNNYPLKGRIIGWSIGSHPLNNDTATGIQHCIDAGIEPFLALRHLQRARSEIIPHYIWIDATIAAELAIKEFLIRYKPEITTLLLEMPSPPIHKLYGPVLESFGLQRSPKLRELSKGVETRNKLVHRPEEIIISLEEANAYYEDVETAIFHLITMLYKDDRVIQYFYRGYKFNENL